MSKLSYQHNKKTGVTYVYSIEKSYWDRVQLKVLGALSLKYFFLTLGPGLVNNFKFELNKEDV